MNDLSPISTSPTQARKPIRGSFIAQLAVSAFLRLHRSEWATPLRPLFRTILKMIGKTDRLVRVVVGGVEIVIPVTHPLPLERTINPEFLNQFGRIARTITNLYPSMTAIVTNPEFGAEIAIIRCHTDIPILACSRDMSQHLILNRNMLHLENVDTRLVPKSESLDIGWVDQHIQRYTNAKWVLLKADQDGATELSDWIRQQVILTIEWQRPDSLNLSTLWDKLMENGYSTAVIFDYSGRYVSTIQLVDLGLMIDLVTHVTHVSNRGGTVTFFHANHAESVRTFSMEERLVGRRKP